jgi:hypothetical protein
MMEKQHTRHPLVEKGFSAVLIEDSDDEDENGNSEKEQNPRFASKPTCPVCGESFYTKIRDAPPTEGVIGIEKSDFYRHEHDRCSYFHRDDDD